MEIRLPYPPIVQNVPLYVQDVVLSFKKKRGVDMDFSPQSLEHIEQIIDLIRMEEGVTVEKAAGTLFSFGCYVGEVIVRNAGGKWIEPDEKLHQMMGLSLLLIELPNGYCNPIGKTFKRMENGEEDSLVFFYQTVVMPPNKAARFSFPPLPDDQPEKG